MTRLTKDDLSPQDSERGDERGGFWDFVDRQIDAITHLSLLIDAVHLLRFLGRAALWLIRRTLGVIASIADFFSGSP